MKTLRTPLSVSLAITKACNLRCLHCSADAEAPRSGELTRDEWLRVVDELIQLKVFLIEVTGGEPLISPHFWPVMRALRPWQSVCVRSNGTLIDDAAGKAFAQLSCRISVSVSLDGSCESSVDALRGRGAFERSIRGITSLVRNKVRVNANFVVSKLNVHELVPTIALLDEMGVDRISVGLLHPQGRYLDNVSVLAPSMNEVIEVVKQIEEARKLYPSFSISANEIIGRADYFKRAVRLSQEAPTSCDVTEAPAMASICSAGSSACAITCEGWVVPCCYCEGIEEYNVRAVSLREAWEKSSSLQLMRKLKETPANALDGCSGCELAQACSPGCRAAAFRLTGSLAACNPETCLRNWIRKVKAQSIVA